MKNLITAFTLCVFFSICASVVHADTFDTDRTVVTRASIDAGALEREIDRRADAVLGADAFVFVSTARTGDVTTVSVSIDAPRMTQSQEIRLEREITQALQSRRVVRAVRFRMAYGRSKF